MAARINSPALGAMRRPVQPRPQMPMPLPEGPAVAAMGGPPRGPAQVAANTAKPPAVGTAPEPARTDVYNPATVDTTGSEAAYNDALKNNQGMIDQQRQYGENYLNALQRRNGSNAALTGMSIGGGSYMGGQRAAFTTGINSLNQSLLPLQQNATNILNSKAGTLANAAGANAAGANAANQFNANRNGSVQDRTAEAGATHDANTIENTANNILGGLKSAGVDVSGQHGATWKMGSDLYTAYVNAPSGSPEQAAALSHLQNYANKVSAAKADYPNVVGQHGGPDSVANDPNFKSVEAYLKYLEQQGYFNGV